MSNGRNEKKAVSVSLLAGLLAAGLLLGGCQPAETGESLPGSTTAGTSAASAPLPAGESTTKEAATVTAASTAPSSRTVSRTTATQTRAAQTTQTVTATTAAPQKGHLSKGDTTLEPVRSLDEILAGLTDDDLACDSYDQEKYLTPYWEGNIVYNESLNFIRDPETGKASAPLLYEAVKILSVKDAALNITYTEGIDYVYEDGRLTLTENSRIPCFDYRDVYFQEEKSGSCFPLKNGGYTLFQEGTYFHSRQVAVTYLHSEPWEGYKPAYQGSLLPNVIQKLKNGEDVSIVYLGDSITKGANASGMFGAAPNMPVWTEMVTAALKAAYPKASITTYSASENGATTTQALKNLRVLCSNHKPDLVVVGFGMNDGSDSSLPPERFQSNIQNIIDTNNLLTGKICDYILLSTTLPNPEIVLGNASYQAEYADVLYDLECAGQAGVSGGVVVGDMTAIHQQLLKTKRFFDMTANNVNHPNDFLIRAYAQLVCTLLIES